jgi:hypothetical protein
MQSSAAVAVRALVMLACAVAVPALAMSGASWSEVLKKFQDIRWPAILSPAAASPAMAESEAPRFPPLGPAVRPPVATCVTEAPHSGCDEMGTGSEPAGSNCGKSASREVPVPISSQPRSAEHRLQELGTRLQRLGATYYVLETWGSQQQLYRCYCKVAVAGNAGYTHCFEAVHGEPLQAMLQVLQQVETWRKQ